MPEILRKNSLGNKLKVYVKSRNETLFDGEAVSVTSSNDVGEFDVLWRHANFVTLIKKHIVIDKGLPTEKKFDIEKGLLCVYANEVQVYAGI